jgi:hypothetical protein
MELIVNASKIHFMNVSTPDDDSMISRNVSGTEWKWHLNKIVCL